MTTITPDISNTQETVKNLQQNIINTTRQSVSDNTDSGNFLSNIEKAIQNVSDTQKQSAEITKNFELGFENDLTKVMIQQQLSSLGFQMTLNVRNKVLSAYKDIMNMPV
tara:strand:+ start:31 stop:357 length:327 start_codon:yes stop_codon:yes gene_type:complete